MIRLAAVDDANQILDIYRPYVENTIISFESEVPSIEEMTARIQRVTEKNPWLVFEEGGHILGYAYASKHRERSAYRWCVDVSIYINEDHHGRGIGKVLYTALFTILRHQGYCSAYAGICLPNEKSVGIHECFGFKKVAHYNSVGYKLGDWHDVGWWEMFLKEHCSEPDEPLSIKEVGQDFLIRVLDR